MRWAIWFSAVILTLIIQATLLPFIKIYGTMPDLLLIVVVSSGMLFGKEQGLGIGFFSGLLQDLSSGGIFGLNILTKMATGYLSGMTERKVFKENILLPLLAIALATVFSFIMSILLLLIFGFKVAIFAALLHKLLPLLLYNLLFAIPINQLIWRLGQVENK